MICPLTTNDLVQKMSPSYFKTQKSNTGLSSEVLHIVFVALLYFSEVINDGVVVQQSVDQSCFVFTDWFYISYLLHSVSN